MAFFSGIPGSIGGALRMNGGAYGGETKDVLIEARGVDRQGNSAQLQQCRDGIFLSPLRRAATTSSSPRRCFRAAPAIPDAIAAEMAEIKGKREKSQPRNRTGGSTFKNPPGMSAWKLVDEAGCRGLKVGQAKVSELHSNFLITLDGASAADIETLGETVRARVKEHSGVDLEWEIKRIGVSWTPQEIIFCSLPISRRSFSHGSIASALLERDLRLGVLALLDEDDGAAGKRRVMHRLEFQRCSMATSEASYLPARNST